MILNNVLMLINNKLVKRDVMFSNVIERIGNNLGKGIDCNNLFLMPGLRNAHVHLGSRLVNGAAIGLSKYEYFDNIGFTIHKKRSNSDVFNASMLACAESLLNGVTHVDTMDMNPEIVIKAIKKVGLNYTACLAVKDYHTEGGIINEQFKRTLNLNGNKLLGLANEFECSPQLIREGLSFAKSNDIPIHMHVLETIKEVKHFKSITGIGIIDYLNNIGFLDFDVRLAHCTFADSKDILTLATHDVPVLHCPSSNMSISGKVPNVKLMLRDGVKVWIGTDSFAWNPNPSVLSEALRAVELDGITPLQAYLLTHEKLIIGSNANFSLVDLSLIKPFKSINEFLLKLMSKPIIKSVFINGREVVSDGVVLGINVESLNKKVLRARNRILKGLN